MNTKITHFLRFGEKGGGLKEALFWGSFTQGTFLSYSLFFFFFEVLSVISGSI